MTCGGSDEAAIALPNKPALTALGVGRGNIFRLGAGLQMRRTNTGWIVALMHDNLALFDWTTREAVNQPVRPDIFAI